MNRFKLTESGSLFESLDDTHFIDGHFQFHKQYSCNSCEELLFNNQFEPKWDDKELKNEP